MSDPRVLHCGSFRSVPVGVRHQLDAEVAAATETGLPWDTVFWSCEDLPNPWHRRLPEHASGAFRRKSFFTNWLVEEGKRYDAILLRYPKADLTLPLRIGKLPPVVTMHHSMTQAKLASRRRSGLDLLGGFVEGLAGALTFRSVAGVVGVTNEVRAHEAGRTSRALPSTVFTNGVDLRTTPLLEDSRNGAPEFVIVASYFAPWIGLDRVLAAFGLNPALGRLHVIGELPEALHRMAGEVGPCVTLHGLLSRERMLEVWNRCDVGLGSFAYDRKGASEGGQLKVKEYLAAGLPVITAYPESGLPSAFPYLKVSSVDAVQEWAADALRWRDSTRGEIRRASRPWIEKGSLLQEQYAWITQSVIEEGSIPSGRTAS